MATFDSHPKSLFWSNKNLVKPNQVALNSHKKFWFDCGECGHPFEQDPNHINTWNRWCPYCSNQKLCENNECISCNNKSFASHPKSIYFSNTNELTSRQLFLNSNKKFKFNCDKCEHKFDITLNKITSLSRWCPYCSNKKLCENKQCSMCRNNSFASVERSKYLNDKSINPRLLFKNSNKIYEFDCNICNNIFPSYLSYVTKGVWCPLCLNKTELIVFNELKQKYANLVAQYKVNWCKNKIYLPFDFVIQERKIIIELDGNQHIKQVSNWNSPQEIQKRDLYKMKCANENGFSVIRILQEDVFKNKYDWLNELISNIEKITNDNKVQNIYMCKNNEYKLYILS
jgi:very-short-patch-repair endonuclease